MAAARSIDHVVLAVRDLDAAAERLLTDHGLASVAGGRHLAWGTANRIVPLGDDYLELLAVVDPNVAGGSAVGRAVDRISRDGDRWFAVCIADADLDATAAPPELHPGRTLIEHRVAATGIAWIEMGDDGHLTDWLGDADLPIWITSGSLGLRAVSVSTADGGRIDL